MFCSFYECSLFYSTPYSLPSLSTPDSSMNESDDSFISSQKKYMPRLSISTDTSPQPTLININKGETKCLWKWGISVIASIN